MNRVCKQSFFTEFHLPRIESIDRFISDRFFFDIALEIGADFTQQRITNALTDEQFFRIC